MVVDSDKDVVERVPHLRPGHDDLHHIVGNRLQHNGFRAFEGQGHHGLPPLWLPIDRLFADDAAYQVLLIQRPLVQPAFGRFDRGQKPFHPCLQRQPRILGARNVNSLEPDDIAGPQTAHSGNVGGNDGSISASAGGLVVGKEHDRHAVAGDLWPRSRSRRRRC